MDTTVGKELAALQRLGVPQLKARYAELFGEQPDTKNRAWLVKRLSWRLQALAEGDLSERARRRAAELGGDPGTVLADQTLRDERDRSRAHSPLEAAPGAVELDTTGLSVDQVVARIVELVEAARR